VDQATEAISKINGTEHFGNMIFLSYVERPSGGMPAGGGPIDYSKLILKVKFDGGDEADNNLYVGGLPSPQIDQEQLTRLFTDLGLTIARSKILSDNRGKGFSSALVQMRSHEDAKFAIDSLNGKTAESFGLKAVPLSEPSPSPAWLQTQSTGARSSSALSAMPVPEVTHGNLFIGSLPRGFGETELNKLFEECGTIVSCKITRTYEGESKGSGFVKMSCAEEAKFCIESLNGFNGLVVKPAANDKGGKGYDKGGKGYGGKDWLPLDTLEDEFEMNISASFSGDPGSDGKTPSETLFVVGLPSPKIEEFQLSGLLSSVSARHMRKVHSARANREAPQMQIVA
jgi:RNA recognition motif-containing protein